MTNNDRAGAGQKYASTWGQSNPTVMVGFNLVQTLGNGLKPNPNLN
jgi:hypothetical protein